MPDGFWILAIVVVFLLMMGKPKNNQRRVDAENRKVQATIPKALRFKEMEQQEEPEPQFDANGFAVKKFVPRKGPWITPGKDYPIVKELNNAFAIKDDRGVETMVSKQAGHFEIIY